MSGAAQVDANQHLKLIRTRKGLDPDSATPPEVLEDLKAALLVLSDQLYQKSTHFLLELIQNADDSQYEVSEPTLHITYAGNHLRVDCNEVGFSPKDVDAICSIGKSSKAGAGISTQYIGEKGIGFKSVFKSADVVWVSSREYEFKFDKAETLGMIAPILDAFPAAKRSKWTSFYLQLSKNYNANELVKELESLDARLLIFLRRLRTIVVTICGANDKKSTKVLTRANSEINGKEAILLGQDDQRTSYIVMRHRARSLPPDEKRAGVSESELLLAFPVDEANQPRLGPQDVFAFLPIRNYRFKFLIQADFLLIANREDVDNSSKWNQALRGAFINAMVECVKWFNSGPMRYTWPRYLPERPSEDDFFTPLKRGILDRLSREPVLEAWSEKFMPASQLIYVPRKFMDKAEVPLTVTSSKRDVYISQGYTDDDYKHLELLGVTKMNELKFLDHLEEIARHQRNDFVNRPADWHSALATVLANIWEEAEREGRWPSFRSLADRSRRGPFSEDRMHHRRSISPIHISGERSGNSGPSSKAQERIKKLPLIRLRDGRWICGEGNTVFFPGHTEQWEIPGGIDVLVADPEVVKDPHRARLLSLVGVKNFEVTAITQLIVSNHSDKTKDPSRISRMDLISQVRFLYKTGWRNMDGKPLWFATEFDSRAPGSEVYLDDDRVTHPASKYFSSNRQKFQFIHPDYLQAHPQDPTGWLTWLETNMSLSNTPRLVRPIREVTPRSWVFELSADFQYVIDIWSPLHALTILCDNWYIYLPWIEAPIKYGANATSGSGKVDPAVESSYRQLKGKICSMMVKCMDGSTRKLEETFLPIGQVPEETKDCVALLDVPDPENLRWQHLANFGVGVKQDVQFYLRCLETLSSKACDLRRATFLFEQIQACCTSEGDRSKVSKFFRDKKRKPVYVPISRNVEAMPNHGAWLPLGQCLWSGPSCLRIHFSLKDIYPSCKRLFTDVLGVGDVTMKDLILEIVMFRQSDDLSYMRDVFVELEKFLENDKTYTMNLQSLNGKSVWPVIQMKHAAGDFDDLRSSKTEWFIADTQPLRDSFVGIVPLLAFSTDDISRMERLFHGLELDSKRLSRAVKSVPRTEGRVAAHIAHTEMFRSKYDFIVRLVQPSAIDKQKHRRVIKALQDMSVYTAERIVQRSIVKVGTEDVEGREQPGSVVLSADEESLKIFVKEQYLERERNPCELVQKLAFFTGINERKNGYWLLQVVLTEPSPSRISDVLADQGVPMWHPEDGDEVAPWLDPNRPRMPHDLSSLLGGFQQFNQAFTVISSMSGAFGNGGDSDDSLDPDDFDLDFGDSPFGAGFRVYSPGAVGGGGEKDEPLAFLGEQFVSKALERVMGEKYLPEEHWTSPLRTKAGLSPIPSPTPTQSSFTIKDIDGIWTMAVAKLGYPDAGAWASRPPTWHIEVKTTRGPVTEEFVFSGPQFERARKFAVRTQLDKMRIPSDVVLLVRVYNAEQDPQIRMYADPWDLLFSGSLRLRTSGTYFGNVVA